MIDVKTLEVMGVRMKKALCEIKALNIWTLTQASAMQYILSLRIT